ncbi:hypothetical protein DFQ27_005432 [Actinomortierella ambigua]|uniref:Uncharacterized protein n=1 Tax=Actinomortierella ambigua TaxID=1343610 RepID=A0A9P6Q2C4_9FUNG|nr:hypothetical protein DFQ27_005432 [Actinomortierella ambigua]
MKFYTFLSALGTLLVASTVVSAAPVEAIAREDVIVPKLLWSVPDNTTKAPERNSHLHALARVDIELTNFWFENVVAGVVQSETAKMSILVVQTGHRETMSTAVYYKNKAMHCSSQGNFCMQTVTVNCSSKNYEFDFFYAGKKHRYNAGEIHTCDSMREGTFINIQFYAMTSKMSFPFDY